MFKQIAKNIVEFSLDLHAGEKLNIIIKDKSQDVLGKEIEKYAQSIGVITRYFYDHESIYNDMTDEEFSSYLQREIDIMKDCDACALVRDNIPMSLTDIGIKRRQKFIKEVHFDIRCSKKWNLTCVPSRKEFSTEEEYLDILETYLKSSSINYKKFSKAMDNLVARLRSTDKVRIIAKNTNISFSIKGLPVVKCISKRNLPDGEVFTAPIKESVNGYITYNLPSIEGETIHNNIYFEFENGRIVHASSDHTSELLRVLGTDEGARYIGEFSFGLNPFITKCYNNTLYDEKISGTIHLTPGNAYERCNNGNKSVIHWDIVQSHLPEFGGGEIWLDNTLIRKDGLFVVEDLKCLNPDQLIPTLTQNKEDIYDYEK